MIKIIIFYLQPHSEMRDKVQKSETQKSSFVGDFKSRFEDFGISIEGLQRFFF